MNVLPDDTFRDDCVIRLAAYISWCSICQSLSAAYIYL